MADTTVMATVGKGLVELLKAEAGFAEGDVSLKSPYDAGQAGKIALFLYQVQENAHVRNEPPEAVGETALRPPPLPLDLFYLVTPLAQEPETALRHLEAVMLAFHDHRVLKAPTLPASLVESGNEALRIVQQPLSLEDLNRLWGIFPSKPYRLSVAYQVTPVYVPSTQTIPVKRVTERVARVSVMEKP